MTGYGRVESQNQGMTYVVEVRSVNHRFCDVSVQMPKYLRPLELTVKQKVQEKFERGRFDVSISVIRDGEISDKELSVDYALAKSYISLLESIKKELGLSGEIDLSMLLQLRDVLKLQEKEEPPEDVLPALLETLDSALQSLQAMRAADGSAIYNDLSERISAIRASADEIKSRQDRIVNENRQRLRKKIDQLLEGQNIDPQRLEQEVVLLAEKCDISEEMTRLESHITEFGKFMDSDGAVGRKLDFLLQEMNREANTAASKAMDVAVSHAVVNIKSELEKIRQQVQNIE